MATRRIAAIARQVRAAEDPSCAAPSLEPAPVAGRLATSTAAAAGGGALAAEVPPAPTALIERYDAAEWELRCKLAVAYRISSHYGWDQLVFNHITVKIPNTESVKGGPHFLINPFGSRFDEVTASSLLKVDLAGNILDHGSGSGLLLKQGFVVHSAVHAARPDLICVWHSHHADTTAICMTKVGLLPLSQEALALQGNVSYHPFEGTASDLSERERLAASLGPKNKVMLMENHGPVTAGSSIEEAFVLHYLVTLSCSWQIKAMSAVGGDMSKIHVPTPEELKRMYQRARESANRQHDEHDRKNQQYNEGWEMWKAAVRMMEEKHGQEDIYC